MTFEKEAKEFMENSINSLQPEGCSIPPTTYDSIPTPKGMFVNQGWVCPKCGRVYSPFVQTCSHCNHKITTQENVISKFF